jgi:hypothetical protein
MAAGDVQRARRQVPIHLLDPHNLRVGALEQSPPVRLAGIAATRRNRQNANARFVDTVAFRQRLGYAIACEALFLGGRVTHMSKTLGAA